MQRPAPSQDSVSPPHDPEQHWDPAEPFPIDSLVPRSNAEWLLFEEGFTLAREHEIESLFAIGNGYVGNRASLAEGTPLSAPATFLAGIFVRPASDAVPELMILPDWTGIRVSIEGRPLDMKQGQMLEHRRILDMRHGVLWREWRHRDCDGRVTYMLASRLASLRDRHLLLQSLAFRAENYSGTVLFETSLELAPYWELFVPSDWEARRNREGSCVLPLALHTPDRKYTIALTAAGQLLTLGTSAAKREINVEKRRIEERFQVTVEPGAEFHLNRVVSIATSRDVEHPYQDALTRIEHVFPVHFSTAVTEHVTEWQLRSEQADVQLEGDEFLQRALRFAQYHLISASNPEDERVSIGARALTGEAYKGHVFWDTEIYMLPFYTATHPPAARSLLSYRYHTLEAAREKARSAGFRGAMYPWESADTGEEVTPSAIITPSGEVVEVRNGAMEIHISAGVAYAVWQYWKHSGDDEFLRRAGAEILLESARFWASRGTIESDGLYHIRHVIGPDEYHENVDDNMYTNLMAAWNLRRGAATAEILKQQWPDTWQDLRNRVRLEADEVTTWYKLANAMFTSLDRNTGVFEQFGGYFKKEQVDLKAYEPRSAAMDVILGHSKIQQTNIVKQADVLLAIYLLWNELPADVRVPNFRYYEPRTGHGSSLSPCIHALLAARLGETALAQRYLQQAAEIDLCNNMGNAAGGVHAAALGGLWQAVVFGFAGVEILEDGVAFAPKLLPRWRRLSIPLQWHNHLLHLSIEPNIVHAVMEGTSPMKLRLADGHEIVALPDQTYLAKRSNTRWGPWQPTRGL